MSAAEPLVSVIVRTIGRDTLGEALASIAAQTYPNIEVVLVDARGGGLPGVGETCGRFALGVFGTGEPLPRSRAANVGLESAKGRYAIFLDDDDWFYPEHVARLASALKADPGRRVSYCGIDLVEIGPDGRKRVVFAGDQPYDSILLLYDDYIPVHAALFERSLFGEGCRFDEGVNLFEDWDFWAQLSLRTSFIHVPGAGAAYRLPGGSLHADKSSPQVQKDMRTLCEKWRNRWTTEQLLSILDHARRRLPHRAGEGLIGRIKELEFELQYVRASRSWRWTAPLRKVSRLLQGI